MTFIVGLLGFSGLLTIWLTLEDSTLVHFSEALIKVTNLWAWILTIFALASHYLNRPSNTIKYANRAVYPFYILHQTITIVLAYFIYDEPWGLFVKFLILVVGTFGFSFLIYEFIIRRVKWTWILFGVKNNNKP